jgi:hypothetical protein
MKFTCELTQPADVLRNNFANPVTMIQPLDIEVRLLNILERGKELFVGCVYVLE